MIQRIQSLFLLISTILCGVLFFTPLIDFTSTNGLQHYEMTSRGLYHLTQNGVELISKNMAVTLFLALLVVLHIVCIFLYKNRVRQIRFTLLSAILLVAYFGVVIYIGFNHTAALDATFSIKQAMSLLLIAAIFDYLAIRFIKKDEALVRSIDRIR
ncbi:MAG: DUF4293 domain-containing protein [Bacteroidota bacterium]|nr:DUF4293 domain-containing protein [Bacteroidota bacterium]